MFVRPDQSLQTNFKQGIVQSAVALILRVRKDQPHKLSKEQKQHDIDFSQLPLAELIDAELLFIQRQTNTRDVYSGQIALPGGKCELGETDLQGAIRECDEEVGINLYHYDCKYLGRLQANYQVRKTRLQGKVADLYCIGHVFLLYDQNNLSDSLKIQESEVQAYKWVKINEILNPKNHSMRREKDIPSAIKLFFKGPLNKFLNIIDNNYKGSLLPQIDIGMNQNLWGLTFYMVCQFLVQLEKKENSQTMRRLVQQVDFEFNESFLLRRQTRYFLVNQFKKKRIDLTLCELTQDVPLRQIIMVIVLILIIFVFA